MTQMIRWTKFRKKLYEQFFVDIQDALHQYAITENYYKPYNYSKEKFIQLYEFIEKEQKEHYGNKSNINIKKSKKVATVK